jgi:hypothetical protein
VIYLYFQQPGPDCAKIVLTLFFSYCPKIGQKETIQVRPSASWSPCVKNLKRTFTKTMAANKSDITCLEGASFIIKTPQKCLCFKLMGKQGETTSGTRDLESEKPKDHRNAQEIAETSKKYIKTQETSSGLSSTESNSFESLNYLAFFSAFGLRYDSVSSALRADQALLKELSSLLPKDEIFRCYVHNHGVFKLKGFFIPSSQDTNENEQKFVAVREKFSKLNFSMIRLGGSGSSYELQRHEDASGKCLLCPSNETRPQYHPLYTSETTKDFNSVYHHYEEAIKILNQVCKFI